MWHMPDDGQHQAYDHALKGLFEAFALFLLPLLFEGVTLIESLDVERLVPPKRVDRVFKVWYRGKMHLLHLEFETSNNDKEMMARLLTYHALLHQEYLLPVITVIIYPFPVTMARSPYREQSGDEDIVVFYYRTLPLWKLKAEAYVKAHAIWMYALLPVMQGVTNDMLLQAIQEMVEYYQDNAEEQHRQFVWMAVMLRRSETIAPEDKLRIQKELDMSDDPFVRIFEEDPVVQEIMARVEARARAEAEAEVERMRVEVEAERAKAEIEHIKAESANIKAESANIKAESARIEAESAKIRAESARIEVESANIRAESARIEAESAKSEVESAKIEAKVEAEALQGVVVTLVNMRFPELSHFARESVLRVKNPLQLTTLVKQVATARDKATVEWALETFAA